eukprot:TRINITY_DN4304_c0_g1_i1.p2 TRINITY_DN4304_c0_g1~~TRINITY_DN4304_c0_g1_i1.p2  ORF type:complete len:390 (+),score=49.60 TRINITY_DN4304_c0_g1_i1:139-1308(+)
MKQRKARKADKENRHDEDNREETKEDKYVKEEEGPVYHEVDQLQSHGINAADISKLKLAGLCTVMSVLMCPKKDLINIKGITDQKAEKIYEAAQKIEKGGFCTGLQVVEKRKKIKRLSTGSIGLDTLLGGGIESQAITEVFGEFRTGKTQLANTLAVTAQLPVAKGGGSGKVAFIDTEGTFRPERIRKISERFELNPEEVLDNIIYARAHNVDALNHLLLQAAALMLEEPFALLIIDSIMAPFRADYSGRGELAERQQVLNKVLNRLQKLAEQFNIAVYLTNQVTADPGSALAYGDTRKPIGGNIIAHASTTRLYLKKGKGDQRICRIYDSPSLPEAEGIFQLTEGGVADAGEQQLKTKRLAFICDIDLMTKTHCTEVNYIPNLLVYSI